MEMTLSFSNATAEDFRDDGKPPAAPKPKKLKKTAPAMQPGHVPRPPNAFMLFRSDFVKKGKVPSHIESNHGSLSKIAGALWRALPDEERQYWYRKADEEKDIHQQEHPEYEFRPSRPSKETSDAAAKARRQSRAAKAASDGLFLTFEAKPQPVGRTIPPPPSILRQQQIIPPVGAPIPSAPPPPPPRQPTPPASGSASDRQRRTVHMSSFLREYNTARCEFIAKLMIEAVPEEDYPERIRKWEEEFSKKDYIFDWRYVGKEQALAGHSASPEAHEGSDEEMGDAEDYYSDDGMMRIDEDEVGKAMYTMRLDDQPRYLQAYPPVPPPLPPQQEDIKPIRRSSMFDFAAGPREVRMAGPPPSAFPPVPIPDPRAMPDPRGYAPHPSMKSMSHSHLREYSMMQHTAPPLASPIREDWRAPPRSLSLPNTPHPDRDPLTLPRSWYDAEGRIQLPPPVPSRRQSFAPAGQPSLPSKWIHE
ncbi:hypothetical protein EV121DRAFT_262590 [Schizophyllum commune]